VSEEPEILETLFASAEVRRLELRPGDIVVIKSSIHLTDAFAAAVREGAERAFPDHQIIIMQPQFDIGVMGPA
jgi:hypothetical protein